MASKLITDLGKKIQRMSGQNLQFAQKATAPVLDWIPERDMTQTKVVTLRTASETQSETKIKLRQFNPSYLLPDAKPNQISCRMSGCDVTTPRLKRSSREVKQDLFLCDVHRTKLKEQVSKRCAEKEISFSILAYKHDDFEGYTNLIGTLEEAFKSLRRRWSSFSSNDLLLAEVFLNVRNFLLLTNALLNPNGDNLVLTLPPVFAILSKILDLTENSQRLENLIHFLKETTTEILHSFQIIYDWISLGNAGAKIVAGVGLLGGLGFAASLGWGVGGLVLLGVGGLISGSLIGGGAYEHWYQSPLAVQRRLEMRVALNGQQPAGQPILRRPVPETAIASEGNASGYLAVGCAISGL